MTEIGDTWLLLHNRDEVARLTVTGLDQPWLRATVQAGNGFDELRPIFADDIRLLEGPDSDAGPWEQAQRRIQDELVLVSPTGSPVAEFILHIDGNDAWWRWEDEPFGT